MRQSFDDKFKDVIQIYLPEDVDHIRRLCTKGHDLYWGQGHIDVLAELAGLEPEDEIIDALRVPYILFSAHYFLLDAAIDEHLSDRTDLLFLTHLLFVTQSLISRAVFTRLNEVHTDELLKIIGKRISENSSAIRRELDRRKGSFEPGEADYPIIVGRSNSTLLFYEILSVAGRHKPDPDVLALLSDLVYYLQLGDDLGDWEEDYERRNFTPLLQMCFKGLLTTEAAPKRAVEEQLFLRGVYEEYTSVLIKNFDRIERDFSKLDGIRSSRARIFINEASGKAHHLLTGVVAKKVSYLQHLEA